MKSDLKTTSINLSNTLSKVHLRLEDFPKNDVKVVVFLSSWVNYREHTVNYSIKREIYFYPKINFYRQRIRDISKIRVKVFV